MNRRFLVNASEFGGSKGWSRGNGNVIFENPRVGVQVLHVGWVEEQPDGNQKFLYDQILRAEAGGGMSIITDREDRIGLQQAFRPQTRDQDTWKANWPRVDLASLGRTSWELPRGFASIAETGRAESGLDAASREAEEETGSKVTSTTPLGYVCDNTASSPHLTALQFAEVDLLKPSGAKPDPNEKLLTPLTFFTRAQVAQMVKNGEIYCAFTLSGIAKWLLLGTELGKSTDSDDALEVDDAGQVR